MPDYSPSWAGGVPDVDPTPEADRYGSGLDHDHDTARATTCSSTPTPWATDTTGRDTGAGHADDGAPADDLPAWVDLDDDTAPRRRADLAGEVRAPCLGCLTDDPDVEVARACYQLPTFRAPTVWYQLAARHGLRHVATDERDEHRGLEGHDVDLGEPANVYAWVAPDGLRVEPTGEVTDGDAALSYLDVRGPAGAVEAFVDDLLDAADYVKRELRAPALLDAADAAQSRGERVADVNRLVGRERAAEVVARLPAPGDRAEGSGRGRR